MPSSRFSSLLARLGMVALLAGSASAAPRDFSDDFNDGLLQPSFLLDRDGNLATTFDQTAEPLWFFDFGSVNAPNATIIDVEEQRRRGELRFSSPNNGATYTYAGYTSINLPFSRENGTYEGWTLDPAGALDAPTGTGFFTVPGTGAGFTLTQGQIDAITADGTIIGLPANFVFSVEMRFGHRSGISAIPGPAQPTPPAQGIAIVLDDINRSNGIGYANERSTNLTGDGVEIFIENTAAASLQMGIRRYENGVLADQSVTAYLPGENFDGEVSVVYQNIGNILTVNFVDRRGRLFGTSIGGAFVLGSQTSLGDQFFSGACCFGDGTCADNVQENVCTDAGGDYRGTLTTCAEGQCAIPDPQPVPPIGACCLAPDMCMEVDAMTCLGLGGNYVGDGAGCVGACPNGSDPGTVGDFDGDGMEEIFQFSGAVRLAVSLVCFSERAGTKINGRNARIDALTFAPIGGLTFQLDGNLNAVPDADFNGDGFVTPADMAAALTAFPQVTDDQLRATLLETPGAPDPDAFIKTRQWNRAISRWYRDEVQPLFAGSRSAQERRADRAFLKDLR